MLVGAQGIETQRKAAGKASTLWPASTLAERAEFHWKTLGVLDTCLSVILPERERAKAFIHQFLTVTVEGFFQGALISHHFSLPCWAGAGSWWPGPFAPKG